jgi:hypothetical protein
LQVLRIPYPLELLFERPVPVRRQALEQPLQRLLDRGHDCGIRATMK